MKMKRIKRTAREAVSILLGLLFLFPIVIILLNSMKTNSEIYESLVSLPRQIYWENYQVAWANMVYPRAFSNTVIVVTLSLAMLIPFSAMAAYRIARSPYRMIRGMLVYFMLAMMLPFQTIMISLVQVLNAVGLTGTWTGYSLVQTALLCPFTIFLYRGSFNGIPLELEEAARIDGASAWRTFATILFPLLKPTTVTLVILNAMNIWNDYLVALLTISKKTKMTLQLSVVSYNGAYTVNWELTLATLVIVIVPIMLLYLSMQKHIEAGMTAGSVKG